MLSEKEQESAQLGPGGLGTNHSTQQVVTEGKTQADQASWGREGPTILRVKKQRDYVVMHAGFLRRPDLSLKAKGLLAYLLSLPDDWEIHVNELVKHCKDGRDSVRSALKELMEAGYVVRLGQPRDNGNGRFKAAVYQVSEVPLLAGCAGGEGQVGGCSTKTSAFLSSKTSASLSSRTSAFLFPQDSNCEGQGSSVSPSEFQESIEAVAEEAVQKQQVTVNGFSVYGEPVHGEPYELSIDRTKEKNEESINRACSALSAPRSEEPRTDSGDCSPEATKTSEGGEVKVGGAEQKKLPRWKKKPVEQWNVADFLGYFLDRLAELGIEPIGPKAGMGQHMKILLEKAVRMFGEEGGRRALHMLVCYCVGRPGCRGTGYLLREAERYWTGNYTGRFTPPDEIVTEENF